jgi:O-antigen/teichoic acid export membrane protein
MALTVESEARGPVPPAGKGTSGGKPFDYQVPTLRRHTLNIGSAWLHKFAAMAVSMLITALAVREYGLDGFALLILAMQVAMYAQLIEVGIPSSLSRRLPAYLASGDGPMINALCSSSLALLLAGAVALILALPVFAWLLPKVLHVTEAQRQTAGLLFGLTVAATALQLPLRMGYGILSSMHRFSTHFSLELGSLLVKLLLIVGLLTIFDPPLWVYVAATLAPSLVIAVVEFVVARAALPIWSFRVRDVGRDSLAEIFSLSGASMLGTLATAFTVHGGSIILAMLVQPSMVSVYAIPAILAFNLMSITSSSSAFLSPVASQLSGRDDQRLKASVLISMRYAAAMAGHICLGAWLAGPLVLRIWMGEDNTAAGVGETMSTILVVTSVGMALSMSGSMARGALAAMGWHWSVARIEVITATLGLAVGVALCLQMDNAPLAIAWAVFGATVVRGLVLQRVATRVFRIRAREQLENAARVMAPLLLGVAVPFAFDFSPGQASLPEAVLMVCVTLGVTAALSFRVVLEERHRRAVLSRLSQSRLR